MTPRPAKSRPSRLSICFWHCRRICAFAAASVLALLLTLCGLGNGFEQEGRDLRDSLSRRPVSGDILLIAIDGASLKTYDRWPWPRDLYAQLIDRLGQAGAESIAFDVDFSARSTPAADQSLAEAIERSPATIILPTFRQRDSNAPSGFIENLPLPELRRSAFLAAVNVHTDNDGILRAYGFGEHTDGLTRPSMGAMLAGQSGRLGREFIIDQSIDPQSIPTISFASILSGRFDPAMVRGKSIIVGATAIELGDRYAVPLHGVQAGPVVQAQAGETLRAGRPFGRPAAWPAMLAATLILAFLSQIDNWKTRAIALSSVTVLLVIICSLLEMLGAASFQQMPALFQLVLTGGAWGTIDFLRTIRWTERREARTGLPNGLALIEQIGDAHGYHIVSVRFPRMTEAMAILREEERVALLLIIADRLRISAGTLEIHLEGGGTFCWFHPLPVEGVTMGDQFAGLASLFLPPVPIGGRSIAVTPRIGVASGTSGEAVSTLARAINAANQADKEEELWVLDDGRLAEAATRSQRLLTDLSTALANRDIWIAYQAKMDIASGQIIGAEALMRWSHPELGAISPEDFIPLFEGEQVMQEPTLYALDIVLADLRRWTQKGWPINVSVNISGTLLLRPTFINAVARRLAENADLAAQLTFEVTESAAIDNGKAAIAVLEGWRARGVRISIDDYGTGQSTLTYLKAFPANEIKIDQSFVRDLEHDADDRVLVRSTVELAHALGMTVVAEGVEDAACLDILRAMQCDVAQGWHIGRPVGASVLTQLLRGRQTDAA